MRSRSAAPAFFAARFTPSAQCAEREICSSGTGERQNAPLHKRGVTVWLSVSQSVYVWLSKPLDKRGAVLKRRQICRPTLVEGDNIQKATVVVVGGGGGDRIMAMTATSDSLMEQGLTQTSSFQLPAFPLRIVRCQKVRLLISSLV
jgi:hypothetical protein